MPHTLSTNYPCVKEVNYLEKSNYRIVRDPAAVSGMGGINPGASK